MPSKIEIQIPAGFEQRARKFGLTAIAMAQLLCEDFTLNTPETISVIKHAQTQLVADRDDAEEDAASQSESAALSSSGAYRRE